MNDLQNMYAKEYNLEVDVFFEFSKILFVKTLVYWWYTAGAYRGHICPPNFKRIFFIIIQCKAIILEIQIDDTFLKGLMRFSPGVRQISPILGVFQQSKLSNSRIVGKLCAF